MHPEVPAQLGQRITVAAFGGNAHRVDDRLSCERFSQQRHDAKIERAANVIGVAQPGH